MKQKSDFIQKLDHLFRCMGVRSRSEGCKKLGIPDQTVSRWATGKAEPSRMAVHLVELNEQVETLVNHNIELTEENKRLRQSNTPSANE